MRYPFGLVLFLFALGALRVVGCGEASPCGNCDDGNPCTMDSCVSFDVGDICEATEHGARQNRPVTDGTPCGAGEVCVEGVCGENLCEGVVCERRTTSVQMTRATTWTGCACSAHGM